MHPWKSQFIDLIISCFPVEVAEPAAEQSQAKDVEAVAEVVENSAEEKEGQPEEGVMEVIDDVGEASDSSEGSAAELSDNEDGGSRSVTPSSEQSSLSGMVKP